MAKTLVTGQILLPAGAAVKASAVAHVNLLDTSLADAPSSVVASAKRSDIAAGIARGEALTFALQGQLKSERASYCVEVHIDQEGDGKVRLGDFVNAQSYPVTSFGFPDHISVRTVKVV